jgi:hypothetical protein
MFSNLKRNARSVYLFIEFSASAFFSMMFVVTSLYEATAHSMFAIGQVMGGPIVAAVGSAVASLVTSSLLLVPAMFFVSRANSMSSTEPDGD